MVNHNDGTATLYLHLKTVSVANGTFVDRGKPIGTAGKTGWTACTPHLHFQRQAQGIWFTQSQTIYFEEYPNQELEKDSSYRSGNRYSGDPPSCPYMSIGEENSRMNTRLLKVVPGAVTDWSVYENQTRALHFKYPSDWTLLPYDYDREAPLQRTQESFHISFLDSTGTDVMGLSLYENYWSSPEAFLQEMQMTAKNPEETRFPFARVLRIMEINGQEFIVFEWNNIVTGAIQSAAIAKGRWLYIFHTWPTTEGRLTERMHTLETILGTLQILENQPGDR